MNTRRSSTQMIIRLVDGNVHRLRFTPEDDDDVQLASRVEKALQTNDVVLELGDRLLVIPKHSILTIELTPPPTKLPAAAIRHAQLIE